MSSMSGSFASSSHHAPSVLCATRGVNTRGIGRVQAVLERGSSFTRQGGGDWPSTCPRSTVSRSSLRSAAIRRAVDGAMRCRCTSQFLARRSMKSRRSSASKRRQSAFAKGWTASITSRQSSSTPDTALSASSQACCESEDVCSVPVEVDDVDRRAGCTSRWACGRRPLREIASSWTGPSPSRATWSRAIVVAVSTMASRVPTSSTLTAARWRSSRPGAQGSATHAGCAPKSANGSGCRVADSDGQHGAGASEYL